MIEESKWNTSYISPKPDDIVSATCDNLLITKQFSFNNWCDLLLTVRLSYNMWFNLFWFREILANVRFILTSHAGDKVRKCYQPATVANKIVQWNKHELFRMVHEKRTGTVHGMWVLYTICLYLKDLKSFDYINGEPFNVHALFKLKFNSWIFHGSGISWSVWWGSYYLIQLHAYCAWHIVSGNFSGLSWWTHHTALGLKSLHHVSGNSE